MDTRALIKIAEMFCIEGHCLSVTPTGNGHINDTYLVCTDRQKYILQRINTRVFPDPAAVMENVVAVTEYLGGRLSYIPAGGGGYLVCEDLVCGDSVDGHLVRGNLVSTHPAGRNPVEPDESTENAEALSSLWRMMSYIENAYACESPLVPDAGNASTCELPITTCEGRESSCEPAENHSRCGVELYREIGRGYGKFISDLAGYPAEKLHETIAGFHDTRKRFNRLLSAIERDSVSRRIGALEEIRFALEHEGDVDILGDMAAAGVLPVRVTHNDTKINNVMLDKDTHRVVCVIDLDTVMPGLAVHDFGDMVRSCACTGREDERDISRIGLDLAVYRSLERGFLEGFPDMSAAERRMMPWGAKIMALECGIRFLTDYLEGDTYFKTDYPEHNLVRCRTQFKLVQDMEAKFDKLATEVLSEWLF